MSEIIETSAPALLVLPLSPAPSFSWKLSKAEYTKTIFAKRKMKEYTNIHYVYGFIKSEMGITYQGNQRYDGIPVEIKTELDQIKKFKEKYDKKEKYVKMAHVLPPHKWGRTKPIDYCSLSVMHRPTRHRLSMDYYDDIDLVNCQPQVIAEICRLNGVAADPLVTYCKDPKHYRAEIAAYHGCDKDAAKQLFIRLLFGGSYYAWIKEFDITKNEQRPHSLVKSIEDFMGTVRETVYAANPDIRKDVLKQDKTKWDYGRDLNACKRGVMALWCQTIERRIMEECIIYLNNTHNFAIEDVVPCQDGFMIRKGLLYDTLISELEQHIATKFALNLKFIVKPFDEAIDIPECADILTPDEWSCSLSNKELADRLVELKKGHIITNSDGVFVFYDGRWYNETSVDSRHRLSRFVSEDLYNDRLEAIKSAIELTEEEVSSFTKILRSNTSSGTAFKDIIRHCLSKLAGENQSVEFDSKPLLLGFENGVIELATGEFRPYKPDDYVTLTTLYDYQRPNYSDPAVAAMRQTLETLMQEIQNCDSHLKLLYQVLCSALDGFNYQKFYFFNGRGGNGKGLINRIMRRILGKLCCSPQESIMNSVASNGPTPEVAALRHMRYIIFTEMSETIRTAAFKRLTGGDKLSGRGLYKDTCEFYLSATLVGEFNNAPDFDARLGDSESRRIVDFGFMNSWTDNPDFIGKTIGGITYKEANPYYATQEFIDHAAPVFLDMLLAKYRESFDASKQQISFDIPDSVRRATEKFIGATNIFHKVVSNEYRQATQEELAAAENDGKTISVDVKEMWNAVKCSEAYKSLSYALKRQYSRDAFYTWAKGSLNAVESGRKDRVLIIPGLISVSEDE